MSQKLQRKLLLRKYQTFLSLKFLEDYVIHFSFSLSISVWISVSLWSAGSATFCICLIVIFQYYVVVCFAWLRSVLWDSQKV